MALRSIPIIDKGAWKSIDAIPSRTAQYAGSVYRIDNALTHSWSVFTDHPYGCAFRGLGCPQATFAVESQMDELAEKLGIDPIDLRMKNLLRPGDTTIWGQEMLEERGFGIAECLTRVREAIGWDKPLTPSEDPDVRRGQRRGLLYVRHRYRLYHRRRALLCAGAAGRLAEYRYFLQ